MYKEEKMKIVVSIVAAMLTYNICFGQEANPAPQAQPQTSSPQVQTQQTEKKEIKKAEHKVMKKEPKIKIEKFVGIVDSVDVASSTIKVKNINKKDDVKTFVLGSDVKIKIDGKEGKLDGIKPESHIILKYEGKIEEAKVKEINVQSKKEHKAVKKEHKAEKKEMKKEANQPSQTPATPNQPKTN